MLDFYLIDDHEARPNYPEQKGLELIGELDDQTFDRLKDKKVIGRHFDYYSDFRWDTNLIKQMRGIIQQKQLQNDTDAKQLLLLFDIAARNQSGLIAYGD